MSKTRKNSVRMNMIHFKTLVCRYTRQLVFSKQSFLMLVLQVPVMLIIVALVYKKGCFNTADFINNSENFFHANTVIFALVFIGALMGLLNAYREITKEKEVLAREMYGGLDPVSYVASKFFVMGVIALVQALMLTLGSLIFIDFYFKIPVTNFIYYLAVMFGVIWASSGLGLMISSVVKKSESAVLPVLLIIICEVVLSGVFLELNKPLEIFSYLFPARWGCAVLGNVLNINILPVEALNRAIYNTTVFYAFAALALQIAITYAITVGMVKRSRKLIKS